MRMLCTDCWRTARPDTRIAGSDRVELAAWLCLAVPGLLYCRRDPAAPFWGGGRLRASGRPGWPRVLGTPEARLVHGSFGALLFGGFGLERLLAGAALAAWSVPPLLPAAACAAWLLWQGLRVTHLQARPPRCEAFDEHGRPLPVEALL
ncbi:MAG: hypothetical protein JRG85_11810 [Deltaproteobacteria bacterium]|nr:hypothetical protein [Deltaproteobacteria bacterium]